MAKMNIDWKQFLLEKGEKVGLGVALFLMVVLVITSLFLPRHGFLVPGASSNANTLTDGAKGVETKQAAAVPSDADKPKPGSVEQVAFDSHPIGDQLFANLRSAGLFTGPPPPGDKRYPPEIFSPVEGTAAVVLTQLKGIRPSPDGKEVMILKSGGNSSASAGPGPAGGAEGPRGGRMNTSSAGNFASGMSQYGRQFQPGAGGNRPGPGFPGVPPGGPGPGRPGPGNSGRPGGPGYGPMNRPGMPGGFGQMASNSTTGVNHEWKSVNDVTETTPLAHQVLPVRQAVIVASFPYRQQIEEFQRKLHLATPEDVLNEVAPEAEGGSQENSFRFEGVKVKRRVFDASGKLIEDWKDFDLFEAYKPLLVATGVRFRDEENGPELEQITPDGLGINLLPDFSAENPQNKLPELENKLPTIRDTLKKIKDAENVALPKSKLFDPNGVNLFKRRQQRTEAAPGGNPPAPGAPAGFPGRPPVGPQGGLGKGMLPPGMMGPGGGPSRPGGNMPGGFLTAGKEGVIPDYCRIRVIDVTIEPGKSYEYQLQVVMANPNYKRTKEAASPSYAQNPTLEGKPYVVPTRVTVPPELYIYVADQKEIDRDANKRYQGINLSDPPERERDGRPIATILQLQRWVVDSGGDKLLGEWCVAERVPAYKGEYVGRKEKIDVPVWDLDQEKFVLAADGGLRGRRAQTGREIDFNDPANPTILVDFEGGQASLPRPGARAGRLDERCATEVLLLSDDGRLQCRSSAADVPDKSRNERLKAYLERIKKVKEDDQAQPQGPGGGNRFGGNSGGRGT